MKAGRMRRRIGRTPAEQPVEPAGEIVPWRKDPVAGYHAGGYLAHQRKAYAKRTAGPEHLSRHGSAVHRPEAQLFPAVFAGFACGLGTALRAVGTDPMVLMRMYGMSNFSSHTALGGIVLPGVVITLLFTVFACLACGKIKRARLTKLIAGAIDSEGSGAHSPLPWARKDRRAACMAPASKRRCPAAALSGFSPFHGLFPPVIRLARIQRVSRGPFLQATFIAFIY